MVRSVPSVRIVAKSFYSHVLWSLSTQAGRMVCARLWDSGVRLRTGVEFRKAQVLAGKEQHPIDPRSITRIHEDRDPRPRFLAIFPVLQQESAAVALGDLP